MKALYSILFVFLYSITCAQAQDAYYEFDSHAYQYDMSVYLTLCFVNDSPLDLADYEIAAFCGDECRGVAKRQTVAGAEYGYLRIRSNQSQGEHITFRALQKSLQKEWLTNESLEFRSQDVVGLPSSPWMVHLKGKELTMPVTITAIGQSTLILPFEADIPEGMQLFTCSTSKDVGVLQLEEETEKIQANTPYIVKGEPGLYTFQGEDVSFSASYTVGWLTGVLVNTVLTASAENNQYVLQNQGGKVGFYRVNRDDITVPAYKVYLTVPIEQSSNIKAFYVDDQLPDAIQETEVVKREPMTHYNVMGIPLRTMQRGVNIIRTGDGAVRKVYVK